MSASTCRTNPSFFKIAMTVSAADGDKEWLDFACVITGCGILIVLSSGLWDVAPAVRGNPHTLIFSLTHTLTHRQTRKHTFGFFFFFFTAFSIV